MTYFTRVGLTGAQLLAILIPIAIDCVCSCDQPQGLLQVPIRIYSRLTIIIIITIILMLLYISRHGGAFYDRHIRYNPNIEINRQQVLSQSLADYALHEVQIILANE